MKCRDFIELTHKIYLAFRRGRVREAAAEDGRQGSGHPQGRVPHVAHVRPRGRLLLRNWYLRLIDFCINQL